MRAWTSLLIVAFLSGCAPSLTSAPSSTTPASTEVAPATNAEAASTAAPQGRVVPGSPYKGEEAAKHDQYHRGRVNQYLDDGGGKRRPGEKIAGIACAGTGMEHAAWCQDDKTMIVCEQSVYTEVDCSKVVPSGVCAVNPTGGGSLDCFTP